MNARLPEACDPALVKRILEAEGVSALTARALIRRGAASAEDAKRFLHPSETQLLDPYLLPNMEQAAERIRAAIREGEPICVFGDYDADGICSCTMLLKRLRQMGGRAECYIPLRRSEGYGLTEKTVRKVAATGARLIVTVDNGISAFDEIALCGALGMDVIVTDHHSAGKAVPECVAVVTASRRDSTYPNPNLCGAGVALKLIQALTDDAYSDEELALAAVATIADVVPLTGENRAIAACGLRYVETVPGFSALLDAAGWKARKTDEQTISYAVAPRLNASGRMSTAMLGVELLTTADADRRAAVAERLNEDNQKRKDEESAILEEAQRRIEAEGESRRAVLLSDESWNPGVIGIVASRLCESLHVPVILFSERDGILTGSGRSIERIDLFDALSRFSGYFMRFGGHARAAGVTISAEKFETFRREFTDYIEGSFSQEDFLPSYEYEETIPFSALTLDQAKELGRLGPFGEGNPEPAFRFENVRFASLRTIRRDDKHFCASAVQGDSVLRVVAFGRSDLVGTLKEAADWDLAALSTVNRYRGCETVELQWVCAVPSEEKFHFFDAFFRGNLYNEQCSDDLLAEWFFSFGLAQRARFDDAAMRRAYRSLTKATEDGPKTLGQLTQMHTAEELLALCVFTQLSFFRYDAGRSSVERCAGCAARPLTDSALYRLATRKREA